MPHGRAPRRSHRHGRRRNFDLDLDHDGKTIAISPGRSRRQQDEAAVTKTKAAVTNLVAEVPTANRRIDGLVNAAGGQLPATSLRLNGWNAVLHDKVTSDFLLTRKVYVQTMREGRSHRQHRRRRRPGHARHGAHAPGSPTSQHRRNRAGAQRMAAYVTGIELRVDSGIHNGTGSFLFGPPPPRNRRAFRDFHPDEPPTPGD